MGGKPLGSVQRALSVLEAIASHQPIGVAALCRVLDEDKSAVQRVLVTLAGAGWIRSTGEQVTRWELTERPLVVAGQAQRRSGLVARMRPTLEALRDETGETAMLAVPDLDRIVAVDVVESRHLVRTAPRLGMVLPPETSAGGLALFAHLPDEEVTRFLGAPPSRSLRAEIERTRARGWSLNAGVVDARATSLGAAVLDGAGHPVAVLVVSAPSDRLTEADFHKTGELLARAAHAAGLSPTRSRRGSSRPA